MTNTDPYDTLLEEIAKPENFRVNSDERLAWYTSKMSQLARDKAALKVQYEAMTKDIERDEEHLQDMYGAQAEAVLRDLLSRQRRRNAKSFKFLEGTIGLRTTPEGLRVTNKDSLMDGILGHPELMPLIRDSIDATEFKRHVTVADGRLYLKATGEHLHLPGIELTPAVEKVYIKTGDVEEAE